ncbi:MAG: DUF933 domain-containing protein [Deltaproteobacteria bacterium]|nr:DUF933 domain-containing protein [Deltaproteobacteria bacterium]
MKVGIFGRPGGGKSTLFRALAGEAEGAAAGKGAGVCTIQVPDERVDALAGVFRPKKTTHVSITFEEIDPGETEFLPPPTQAKIKSSEVLALVLRGFSDDFHPAPPGGLDPVREFRGIETELVLADYLVAQKRIERMAKEAQRGIEWTALHKAVAVLEKEAPLRAVPLTAEEARALAGFRFLSRVPLVLVLNVNEDALAGEPYPEVPALAREQGFPLIRLSARIEEEIARLSPPEQEEFLKALGIARGARDRLIRGAFEAMNHICFLTVGEDEVRAWDIPRGTTAVSAAGKIHSDLEKGFIRAEVIPYDLFMQCGSLAKARSEGKLRLEGKDYVVRDGDIMHVRFHV